MAAKPAMKRLQQNLIKVLNKAKSPDTLKALGILSIQLIQERSRRGFAANNSFQQFVFPKLSTNYKNFRKRYSSKLDPTTKPTKSNITFTGQLLRSLQITSISDGRVVIGARGTREGKGKITNEELAELLTKKKGRPFLNLSELDLRKLVVRWRRDIEPLFKGI